MWQSKLRNVYENFEEFLHYDEIYNLAERLGFTSALEAWTVNPNVQGSTNPSDYMRISNIERE